MVLTVPKWPLGGHLQYARNNIASIASQIKDVMFAVVTAEN